MTLTLDHELCTTVCNPHDSMQLINTIPWTHEEAGLKSFTPWRPRTDVSCGARSLCVCAWRMRMTRCPTSLRPPTKFSWAGVLGWVSAQSSELTARSGGHRWENREETDGQRDGIGTGQRGPNRSPPISVSSAAPTQLKVHRWVPSTLGLSLLICAVGWRVIAHLQSPDMVMSMEGRTRER